MMSNRAEQILEYPTPRLFVLGACHVFAFALHERFSWPLGLAIERNDGGLHVACFPESGMLLDAYGWISFGEYQVGRGHEQKFKRATIEIVRERFSATGATGSLYYDPDFWRIAEGSAHEWIDKHIRIFEGVKKTAILDVMREEFGDMASIFQHNVPAP
jgi:hypothetical protein